MAYRITTKAIVLDTLNSIENEFEDAETALAFLRTYCELNEQANIKIEEIRE